MRPSTKDSKTDSIHRVLFLSDSSPAAPKLPMPSDLLPKLLQILFIFALFITVYAPYWPEKNTWYECSTNANYSTNSIYNSNLNLLLPSLNTATLPTGFASLSKGQAPNQVFGLALCRGDASQDECQSCLSTADQDLLQICPSGKSAAIWPDKCFLRYSDNNISSSSDDDPPIGIVYNGANVSEATRFEELVHKLLDNLTDQAAHRSTRMFATGEAGFMSSTTLYGLVQCVRYQSEDDCSRCLRTSMGYIPTTFWGKQGGVVLKYDCIVRFEIYPFYNESVGPALPLPPLADRVSPPPVASTPPTEGGKREFSYHLFPLNALK